MEESIIYVDADATAGEETGASWDDAYTDLQDALAAAGASDQIWVAEGTYVPTTTDDRAVSFVINNGVKVYGGFVGNETALNQRDIDENVTILSGNIGADTQADNSYQVVNITDSPTSTLIDGFTIAEGQADGDPGFSNRQDRGAGLFGRTNASATLQNLIIEDNFAAGDGGGIYVDDTGLTVDAVVFNNNSAGVNGGAIFASGNDLNVFNSLFVDNQGAGNGGGAISTNVLTTSNFVGNTFYDNEGGRGDDIFDESGSFNTKVISNNIFADSDAIDGTKVFLDFSVTPATLDISNNIIDGTVEFRRNNISAESFGEGNLFEAPSFADAESGDFRLQLDSVGIDVGNQEVVNAEGTDVAANPRVYNDVVDIGAYEYGLYLSIDDVQIIEGDTGTSDAEFTVTLSDALDLAPADEVTVEYTSLDRNAKDGSDFDDVTGTLTFDEDTTTQTISVPVTGDTRAEVSEVFNVSLRNPTGDAVITDGLALGTIQNDDQLPAGVESDRFFAPDVDASFYTPSASEIAEILDIIPVLELEGADGIAFLLEPQSS